MTLAFERGLSPARAVLPNGAVVLAQCNGTTPAVAVNLTFLAGSLHDPAGLSGCAYLTGTTIDRGTRTRSAAEIAELLDDRGVALRVQAARHTLTLSCVCLAEDLPAILEVLSDIVRHPSFPEGEVDRRRLDAITSIRQDEDNTAIASGDLVQELLYGPQHPYGRPLKGSPATLERISASVLADFHARWLVPAAARLAVVGAVDAARVVDAAGRLLEDWRGPEAAPSSIVAPPAAQRVLRVLPRPGKAQTDIAYGFTTIRRLDPRYYAFTMMNNILGQFGIGGRLAENIRERQGMAYYAYSTLEPMPGESSLIVRAGVDPQNVIRTLDAIDAEVAALAADGPSLAEFADNKTSLIGSIPRLFETNESIADFLQTIEQYDLGLDFDRRLPQLLGEVSIEDVREAAREALRPEHAAIAIAGPHAAGEFAEPVTPLQRTA